MRQSFTSALYADEFLDVTPPRRHVLVADRPVDSDSFLQIRFVVEIAPAEDAASPHDRLATDLPPANPRKRFAVGSRIRIVEIVDEEFARVLVTRTALALHRLVALYPIPLTHAAIALLIRHDMLDVIDRRIDRSSRFQDYRLESVLGQLLCSPASGNPGSDDDRIVRIRHRQTLGVNGTFPL